MTEPERRFLSKAGAARKPRRKQDDGHEKLKRWSNYFSRRKLSHGQMLDFWKDAVGMVDRSDADIIVEAVEKLAEETVGRSYIEQVLRSDYLGSSSSTHDYLMDTMCFMWFMTHREIISNFAIERNVNILYSYFYGTDGNEAASFFNAIALQLSNEATVENRKSKLWESKILGRRFGFSHVLARLSEFLRHTLRRSRMTEPCGGFTAVFERLSTLAISISPNDKFYPSISDSLREINCIQWYAAKAIEFQSAGIASPILQESPDEVDYPGHLSRLGARHDNDFTEIYRIKLLPTMDEITSKRQDYLPPKALANPHLHTELDRMVDTHFRLLRHDYIQEVKSTICRVFEICTLSRSKQERAIHKLEASIDCRWFLYSQVSVVSAEFEVQGLQLQLNFCEPSSGMYERWDKMGSLKAGTLACLLSFDSGLRRVTFVTISDKRGQGKYQTGGKYRQVFVQLIDLDDQQGLEFLFQQISGPSKPRNQFLLEFGGIIPSRFLPILRNLQELSLRGTHPIGQWILPSQFSTDSQKEKEFSWDLKPILKNTASTITLDKKPSLLTEEEIEALERATVLDLEQCRGLTAGLSEGVSLIQGAPSTGKSFVGLQLVRVLVQNKPQRPIGPIICLFATQNALDKFLKKLLTVEIHNIIRVGGNTESPTLQAKDLKAVVYPSTKPHRERRQIFESYRDLEALQPRINSVIKDLLKGAYSWEAINTVLQHAFPRLYNQFNSGSNWTKWRGDRQAMIQCLGGLGHADDTESTIAGISETDSIWELSATERAQVVHYLLQKVPVQPATANQIRTLAREHQAEIDRLKAQQNETTRRCLQQADVIGVQVTHLAEIIHVLGRLNAKVVVCEEAGEIMEGYLINAIPHQCQHLVQIGDYRQLRPMINSYSLSADSESGREYRLDESMFERLINEKLFPVIRLNVQRRMRPEIADLLRSTLDQDLQDHPTTTMYPDIIGTDRNNFWLNHNNPESQSSKTVTKMPINDWEATMVHEFVCHLVRQGQYVTNDIVVLTPYPSQLHLLQQKLNQDFVTLISEEDKNALEQAGFEPVQGVGQKAPLRSSVTGSAFKESLRAATIDNFHGEEVNIAVVSLVRSNEKQRVGYMKSVNRVHVLLSRAKHGLYIIGDADMLASKVPVWNNVCEVLKNKAAIGRHLSFRCPRHSGNWIKICEPQDLPELSPEGGCRESCDRPLNLCRHPCPGRCHSDSLHRTTVCVTPWCSL